MTLEEFKEYLDIIVEKSFKEGMLYERSKVKYDGDVISVEEAIRNTKRNILGE